MSQRKVILYISMSLDGYIAGENDDLSWLDQIDHGNNNYGYDELSESVDTYIVGRKTYDVVMKLTNGVFDQAKKWDCYILTRTEKVPENGVTYFSGNIENLIADIKAKPGKNIYCDGGGEVVHLLMQKNLIDEYIVAVMPTVLGKGKHLFLGDTPMFKLKALPSQYYENGVTQLRYLRE